MKLRSNAFFENGRVQPNQITLFEAFPVSTAVVVLFLTLVGELQLLECYFICLIESLADLDRILGTGLIAL